MMNDKYITVTFKIERNIWEDIKDYYDFLNKENLLRVLVINKLHKERYQFDMKDFQNEI